MNRTMRLIIVLKVSAIVMFVGGFIAFIFHPGYWDWTFAIDRKYITSLAFHTFIATLMVVSGFRWVSLPSKVPLVILIPNSYEITIFYILQRLLSLCPYTPQASYLQWPTRTHFHTMLHN